MRSKVLVLGDSPLIPSIVEYYVNARKEVQLTNNGWNDGIDFCVLAVDQPSTTTFEILNWLRKYSVPIIALINSDVYTPTAEVPSKSKNGMSEDDDLLVHPADPTVHNRLALLSVENELLCRHSANVMVLRMFDVYGPGCPSVVNDMVKAAQESRMLSFPGTIDDKRTFLYIEDLLALLSKLESKLPTSGKMLFNVGATEAISNKRLAEYIWETVHNTKEGLVCEAVGTTVHSWKIPNIQRLQAYAKWTPNTSLAKGLFFLLNS